MGVFNESKMRNKEGNVAKEMNSKNRKSLWGM